MGAAYFIVLDKTIADFDPFLDGKAVARNAIALSSVATTLGLKTVDEYVSMSAEDVASMKAEFDLGDDVQVPPEQWFDAAHGVNWATRLQSHLKNDPRSVDSSAAVLSDLAEYERVFRHAEAAGAKWHFAVDY